MKRLALLVFTSLFCFSASRRIPSDDSQNWPEYNGDGSRNHFSLLKQIDKINVDRLQVAWTYASGGADTINNRSQMQCNPIIINGILYGVSAGTQAFAIHAETGREIWKTGLADVGGTTSRGVTFWSDQSDERIFFSAGKWMYALNANTGELIEEFGAGGRINLMDDIQRPGADQYVLCNTPATVFRNILIVGTRVNETETALLGDIRAYDTVTGKKLWTFHTIPQKGEIGYNTWLKQPARELVGGANAWAGTAIDRKRGIIYIPTGSAAYDFYGGNRPGQNLFANCLLALDAATGKLIWHYQLVHHDIWDRDPPCPPNLVTIRHHGKQIDAVVQITKQGHIFVFDRTNGNPVFPIHETSFPKNGVPGEKVHPTQPIPVLPQPFTRQAFTAKDVYNFAADRDSIVKMVQKARTGSPYIPIGFDMTIFYPGTDGGAQWGGAAADQDGILYIPAKEIPVYTSLVKKEHDNDLSATTGKKLYQTNCAACHGNDRSGNHDGSYPSLLHINQRMKRQQISDILQKGRAMMPSFAHLSTDQREVIMDYILNKKEQTTSMTVAKSDIPYRHTGYNRWYDRNGYPVSTPPWGTLTSVNLNNGKRNWQVPLGAYQSLTDKGIPPTGTDNYGGPLVTAGGLIFIAASRDEKIRAIDKNTGQTIWTAPLPAAGYASPSTYMVNGKQYVVIACGGGKLNTKSGDQFVAFSLAN